MRRLGSIILFLAGLGLATPSLAATPPDVLFPGSAFARIARGSGTWCAIDPGGSEFQRSGAGAAKISFPDITYFNQASSPQSFLLTGQAILFFTNATSGTTSFVLTGGAPTPIGRPAFTNYAQTYDAATRVLTVSFRIAFPSCTLPVLLYYRG